MGPVLKDLMEICDYFASNIDNPNTKNEVLKHTELPTNLLFTGKLSLLSLYQNCS